MISFPDGYRNITRSQWRTFYRLYRIAVREAVKAAADMMIYGTGVVMTHSNGESEHVPLPLVPILP